jgi:hypothetical protein
MKWRLVLGTLVLVFVLSVSVASAGQLISNGTFDSNVSGWTFPGTGGAWDGTTGNPVGSVKLTGSGKSVRSAAYFTVGTGATTFEFDALAPGGCSPLRTGYRVSGTITYFPGGDSLSVPADSSWHHFSLNATGTVGKSITVEIECDQGGTPILWLDNVSLVDSAGPTNTPTLTPTLTLTPTPITPTSTATPTPTSTPWPTWTYTPSVTPIPSVTPTLTVTPIPPSLTAVPQGTPDPGRVCEGPGLGLACAVDGLSPHRVSETTALVLGQPWLFGAMAFVVALSLVVVFFEQMRAALRVLSGSGSTYAKGAGNFAGVEGKNMPVRGVGADTRRGWNDQFGGGGGVKLGDDRRNEEDDEDDDEESDEAWNA